MGTCPSAGIMRRAPTRPKVDGLQCSQGDGNIMFISLSVVRIITTLKKPAGHFVASVTPQLVDSWGLAGKHDILSHGYTGWLTSSSSYTGLVMTVWWLIILPSLDY